MALHGWGVVCGLDVEIVPGNGNERNKIKIEPGLAIDCFGREILVCEPQFIPIIPEASECDNNQTQQSEEKKYAVCLKFKECKTDSFTVLYGACDQKEKFQFNHTKDWFEIKVVPFSRKDTEEHPYKKEKFCPHRYGCEKDYNKSLHHLICNRLNDYPECCNSQCVILATLVFGLEGFLIESKYSNRRLVYNNPLLYDLISCYHGDLPRVCSINWHHNAQLSWVDFEKCVRDGLIVTFNTRMKHDSINTHTFQVAAITNDDATGYHLLSFIPAEGNKINVIENENDVTVATFYFESRWMEEEVTREEGKRSMVYSALADGAEFEIILKGSSIFSEDGKALDGCFKGNLRHDHGEDMNYDHEGDPDRDKRKNSCHDMKPDLPSGVGTQGTDFISWFSVHPKPRPRRGSKEEDEDSQVIEEGEYENE